MDDLYTIKFSLSVQFYPRKNIVVFKYLLVYNHLQQDFTDRSIIIGGSYCKLEDIERGKFKYFRQQLDTYGGNNTKLTDITVLSCIYGTRGHLSSSEKDSTSLDWEDTQINRGIAKANLSLGYLIKQNMGGWAPYIKIKKNKTRIIKK